MKTIWIAVTAVGISSCAVTASAQTPPVVSKPSAEQCALNPFKAECGPITITPGAPGTGLNPLGSTGPGLESRSLRPMDRPSFDRGSLRLPKEAM